MAPAGIRHPRKRDVKAKSRGGRPSDYRAGYAAQAYNYTLLGATDKMLAEFFSVSEQTINAWKGKHPKFLESIKRGKAQADAEVAGKLFQRANGFHVKAVKIFSTNGESFEHEYQEFHPPDVTAQIFWLKNRQPELWRDKHALEHTGKDGGPMQVEEMSAADIDRELARMGALQPNGHG